MKNPDFEYHFPFETPRDEQRKLARIIAKAFETPVNGRDKPFKYFVLEAPTGIGKSPIAYTVASYLCEINKMAPYGAYILTSMKGLQDQYYRDFKHIEKRSLHTVKGKANYMCGETKKRTVSCELGECWRKRQDDCYYRCPYIQDREATYKSDIAILNYAYFLSMNYDKNIQRPRDLLVLDECHNIENELLSFASVQIIKKDFEKNDIKVPTLPSMKATNANMIKWLKNSFMAHLKTESLFFDLELSKLRVGEMDYYKLKRNATFVNGLMDQCTRLFGQADQGVTIVVNRDGKNKLIFKLLKADTYAKEFVFDNADKVLMMSATVLDINQFCASLGLDRKEVCFFRIDSPFKEERRPIINIAKHSVSYSTMDTVKYELVKQVREILDKHPNERGVIHTQSYNLAEFLVNELDDPRLFVPKDVKRDKLIQDFLTSQWNSNGVIVSPSIKEGYDFKDDYARFCILLKCPYPSLADNFVKQRLNEDPQWYYMETLRDIIQSTGRVVRNEKDWAVCYILDQNIMRLIVDYRKYLPKWWVNSVKTDSYKWNPKDFDSE